MTNISVFKKLLFALLCISFVACDSDFNNINSDIIEDDVHHNGLDSIHAKIVAYDRPLTSVQSNNMPINALGIFNHPLFGEVNASYVTQLELGIENPALSSPVIDSVYVYIPYFSKLQGTDSEGASTYKLDSLYGNTEHKMKLRIYESGYYLRTTDPVTTQGQKYYSGDREDFEGSLVPGMLNNDEFVGENEEFYFHPIEVRRIAGGKIRERFAPGLYAYLDKSRFQNKLFSAEGRTKLVNNNVFREYFRGIYFKTEQSGGQNAMAMLNTAGAKIVVRYTDKKLKLDGTFDPDETEQRTLTINLRGNSVNYLKETNSSAYNNAINTSNAATGDDRLHIKGGAGSMAVIRINDASLDQLRRDNIPGSQPKAIINEANLTFYVDEAAMGTTKLPKRIYLYDIANKRPLYDYYTDVTTSNVSPKDNKFVHDGRYSKVNGKGLYRIRITNHINNLVNKDSTNVPIGLVVTENINLTDNGSFKPVTPFSVTYVQKPGNTTVTKDVNTMPFSSVINPLGVVLYGNNIPLGSADYDKRFKLEIFYTKPE